MRSSLLVVPSLAVCVFLSSCSGSSTTAPPPPITVTVTPTTATVSPSTTKQFMVTVTGTTNTAVTWQVNGTAGGNSTVGTINSTGLYASPSTIPNPATVTVTAVSVANPADSGSAAVTIAQQTAGTVVVTPNPINVAIFTTQQFTATVNGVPSTAVTWQVNGVTGGSQATGYVSTSGLFVAPGGVPTMSNGNGGVTTTAVTVTAVSTANTSSSGSASVTIFPPNQNPQGGHIQFGTSGGNQNDSSTSGNTITCCGGTLGSLVTRGGTQYILSNNHVLACTDLGTNCALGNNVIQPGLVDARCGQGAFSIVGQLSQFYNLETGTAPKIDAAIAQAITGAVDASGNILYLGATTDANNVPLPAPPHGGSGVPASINMAVAKSGRSTGLTCSTVFATMTVSVKYQKGCGTGTTFTETFTNQVDITGGSFSAPGDSGSLIVDQSTADPVALLYAGSDTDTVGNPVSDVLNFFQSSGNGVTFVGGAAHQVIGCTLPLRPASASLTVPTSAASTEALQRALAARDAHAPELLGHPEVQAVGVGTSFDNPAEAAILLFVTNGQRRTNLPATVDGIRTRIIEGETFAKRGALTLAESAALEESAPPPQLVYAISDSELARAKAAHSAHVDEWMQKPGVQGFGITSSADAPGEAALMIFLIRGVAHPGIPPVIDGVRTRVRESSRFRAGFGDGQPQRGCSPAPPKKAQPKFEPELGPKQ